MRPDKRILTLGASRAGPSIRSASPACAAFNLSAFIVFCLVIAPYRVMLEFMKAYSVDLREGIIGFVKKGASRRKASGVRWNSVLMPRFTKPGAALGVSHASVWKKPRPLGITSPGRGKGLVHHQGLPGSL